MAKEDIEKTSKEEGKDKDRDKKIVAVKVDNRLRKIKSGNYSVADFKKEVEVPENYDLDQLIDGKFEAVDESKKLHIKGGEVFVSHVRTGSSS